MNSQHTPKNDTLPDLKIEQSHGISLVWLVPLIAVLIGAWLIFKTLSETGPTVTISFKTADGIVPDKTQIRYKNVQIGKVKNVRFGDDLDTVDIQAELSPEITDHITETTRFWVVRPRFDISGISGLSTLVSGAYIALDPGTGGDSQRHFVGLEEPPTFESDVPGKQFTLQAEGLGSINIGTPIYYRRIKVGQVTQFKFSESGEQVDINIFIQAPYDNYVRSKSRFWNASGIDIIIDTEGVQLKAQSLKAMLAGGIAFDIPKNATDTGELAKANSTFYLFDDQKHISDLAYSRKTPALMYFNGSVRGLRPGAPVEFHGIKVGTVVDIHLDADLKSMSIKIPVRINLEQDRINLKGTEGKPRMAIETMVKAGLRAKLKTGNLLTGQLFVDLDILPGSDYPPFKRHELYPIIPTLPTDFEAITANVRDLLKKFNQLPLEQIGKDLSESSKGLNALINSGALQNAVAALNRTMIGADQLVNETDLKTTLLSLKQTSAGLNTLISTLNQHADPLLTEATKATASAALAATHVENMLQPQSPTQQHLNTLLRDLSNAAKSVRSLTHYLERHPSSLVFGKGVKNNH